MGGGCLRGIRASDLCSRAHLLRLEDKTVGLHLYNILVSVLGPYAQNKLDQV